MTNEITVNRKENTIRIVTLAPETRLDAFSAPKFREEVQTLLDDGIIYLVFDLSRTPFLDSAGMAALVSALKQCRQRGGDVRMVWPQAEPVKRILALTKFDRVFEMKTSATEALGSF